MCQVWERSGGSVGVGGGRCFLHGFCCLGTQIGRVASECATDQYSSRAPSMTCQIMIKELLVIFGQEADGGKISCVIWFWIYRQCWCNTSQ
jgi:hypothetical protein